MMVFLRGVQQRGGSRMPRHGLYRRLKWAYVDRSRFQSSAKREKGKNHFHIWTLRGKKKRA